MAMHLPTNRSAEHVLRWATSGFEGIRAAPEPRLVEGTCRIEGGAEVEQRAGKIISAACRIVCELNR